MAAALGSERADQRAAVRRMALARPSAVDAVVFRRIAAEAVEAEQVWPGLTVDEVTHKITG